MKHAKATAAAAVAAAGLIAAPVAHAGAHTVTYTVWVDNPQDHVNILYIANEPASEHELAVNRGAYYSGGNFNLGPGERWTAEASMDNPTQWAYLNIVYNGTLPRPGIHCEIAIDGAIRATGGQSCTLRRWGMRGDGTM
ncbi:hypothetical protein [Mycobacteroides abscessus]|uniref:hypothetical protein n=1 Tax=Mycobacteroides abscessus TaxID=36809 RepID=UPI000C26A427|nr:hypothetical protein [Mycobacteroides abscessus]